METDIRWKQRFENFTKAYKQLKEFIELPELNKFEKQGLIQCFEYTFELAWKTAKDYLEDQGFIVNTPRQVIQSAVEMELIKDGHTWIDALDKRNLMTHTYDESIADLSEKIIRGKFYQIITALHDRLKGEL
jgi:nucleotidyltransferase substrate binding protein (TIGR01987 family)